MKAAAVTTALGLIILNAGVFLMDVKIGVAVLGGTLVLVGLLADFGDET